jgi:serine/threonine protein kinase
MTALHPSSIVSYWLRISTKSYLLLCFANLLSSHSKADITPTQFILINGIYKVNDFNRCRFMRFNATDNSPCGFTVGANPGKVDNAILVLLLYFLETHLNWFLFYQFRAPEEYEYKVENEMIDIYSMGNIFYSILSGDMPFEDIKEKDAQKKVKRGERPKLPESVLESDDIAIKTILSATERCWKQDPNERPSASSIRDEFKLVLDDMAKGAVVDHTKKL